MSLIYPQSMHCRFEGFPAVIEVICGRAFSETRSTPYSFGSRVLLTQTPNSGVLQGTLVAGQALPTLEIIHSDTGEEAACNLKVAHYGYGTFYRATASDAYCTLAIVKGLRVEATGINRAFETVDVWTTLIPATTDLTNPGTLPDAVWTQDAAAGAASSVTWYSGTAASGTIAITGRLQLGGDVSIVL